MAKKDTLPPSPRRAAGFKHVAQGTVGRRAWEVISQRHSLGALGLVSFVAAWEIAADLYNQPFFLPAPSAIAIQGYELFASGMMWVNIAASLTNFAIGMALALLSGIPIGVALGWYRKAGDFFDPLISAMYSTPAVVLLPLVILWVGIGIWSEIFIVYLGSVFPVIINTMVGIKGTDHSLIRAARSFRATDTQIFTTIAIPAAVPSIIAGVWLAIGRGLISMIFAEMYASKVGLGNLVALYGSVFETAKMFVAIIVIVVIALVLTQIVKRIESRVDAWRPVRNK